MKMGIGLEKPNKVKAKLIVEVEAEFYDDESSEETLRYCVEQDLEDIGYNVIDVSTINNDKTEQLQDVLENLTEYVESHSDNVTNRISARDILEYIDEMWKVFGVDSRKNRFELSNCKELFID